MDAFDVSVFKILAKDQLIRHIESVHNNKDLIIEQHLMKPLERIVGVSSLREHGVEKIYKLENAIISNSSNLVYIVRPTSKCIRNIIKHHEDDLAINIHRSRVIILFGGRNIITEHLLESSGLYDVIKVEDFTYDFIVLDNDILSMESFDFYEDLYIKQIKHPLYSMAQSLATLLSLVGYVEEVTCIGANSLALYQAMQIVIENNETDHIIKQVQPEFTQMYIFDRAMDSISFLLSEFSYSGLVGEVFQIKSGFIELDKDMIGQSKSIKCLLTSSDTVYEEIRDLPVSSVFPLLKSKAQHLQEISKKAGGLSTVGQFKEYVSNDLKKLQDERQSLMIHICCGESIMKVKNKEQFDKRRQIELGILAGSDSKMIIDYINDSILHNPSTTSVIRLICLWNNCLKNANPKQSMSFSKLFIQKFGLEHIITFNKLNEANLFHHSKQFMNLTRFEQFDSIPVAKTDISTINSKDLSYPNGGCYRPLISTIIDKMLTESSLKSTSTNEKDRQNMYGTFLNQVLGTQNYASHKMSGIRCTKDKKSIMVVFIGAVTYSEIGSLRILAKKFNINLTICASSIQTGDQLTAKICQNKPIIKMTSQMSNCADSKKSTTTFSSSAAAAASAYSSEAGAHENVTHVPSTSSSISNIPHFIDNKNNKNNYNSPNASIPANSSNLLQNPLNNLSSFRNKSSTKLNEAQTFINDNFKKIFK